ncbi:hypothetical protein [Flavobacterium sp. 83]|uniref:hypothetical protein n=1 Tax=Flavobacterium sp. 83 TaxID=1131812 RepID=UPI00054FE9C6|nr:hypothetical protein [Flavobacterium sp. 83]
MNKNEPNNQEDQEIDLSQISKKIRILFQEFNTFLFRCIQFFVKNAIVVSILALVGVSLGIFLDHTQKAYNHQIIVMPNFGSTDYLYSKIELIESKIKEGDTVFLKEVVGIKKPKQITKIEINPIVDVYKFIENKPENFELIKLIAEDGDIKKTVEDNLTSKNYTFHKLSFITGKLTSNNETVEPLLNFLNNTDYYKKIQKGVVNNIQIKMVQNDSIISQINAVLNGFSNRMNGATKSDKLVYYNENTQLNDIIKTKEGLINEQGTNRLSLISLDKIIKENSSTLNIKNSSSVNGKLKFVLPILFILCFILLQMFIAFYRKQSLKALQNR